MQLKLQYTRIPYFYAAETLVQNGSIGAPDKLNLTVLYGNGPQEYSLGILAVVIIHTKNQQLVG